MDSELKNYLSSLSPIHQEYFRILSKDFPEFLFDYIETPRMQKQAGISCSCGTYYSKMFPIDLWYSSLDHSVAVALIIWHFTHDKKQTLAGLFHDISTPVFKHCIDYMNGDHEHQESTEDLTRKMIAESKEIMDLLKKDNITLDEVADYHIYPIADNDTPMLSADRLEYTLSNGLGQVKKMWGLEEVKKIYSNIYITTREDGIPEMCFKDVEIAERFVEVMSTLSIYYMDDKRRFAMQFLADIMKKMSERKCITISDLYELSEAEVIQKIEQCHECHISECFQIWKEGQDVKVSNDEVSNHYCINVKGKKRYINPLVSTQNGIVRISEISPQAKKHIDNCLNYTFDRYVYMDFDLV